MLSFDHYRVYYFKCVNQYLSYNQTTLFLPVINQMERINNMGMLLVKTSPCCKSEHPGVLLNNIRMFCILKSKEEYERISR